MSTVPEKVRKRLYARAGDRCERCGIRRNVGLHVSHRIARGMGGKAEDWKDLSQWNLLCGMCHLGHVEMHPEEARLEGWKVPRGETSRNWPCRTWQGWAYLTPGGGYEWPPVQARG